MTTPATITQVADLVPYSDSDDTPKRLYFSWRICGFSKAEAAIRSLVAPSIYKAWMQDDSFASIESQVPELRQTAQEQTIQMEEDRNRRKIIEVDSQVLDSALAVGIDGLGKQTFEYIKGISGRQSARVKQILGMPEGQSLPSSFDEILIMVARNNHARNENAENGIGIGPPLEEDYGTSDPSETEEY